MGFERRFGDAASLGEQSAINLAEGKHAGRALSYAWRLAKGLICTSLRYSETPPDALASLISPSEETRARGLRLAKDFCKIMRRADSEARGDEFIVGVYSSWIWPRTQWVREQLVSLAEFDFEVIPPDVETACYAKWRGCQQTVIVEDGFNVLENATRETNNHALSRTSRWWRLVSSQVMKNYDRDDVTAASAAEVCETELPNTFFSAKGRDFSMGNDKLEKLSLPEWSSPSPESWDLAAASLLALR